MKYYIDYQVRSHYIAEVEADSVEEALRKGETTVSEADFGEGTDIECLPYTVEDEKGICLWER